MPVRPSTGLGQLRQPVPGFRVLNKTVFVIPLDDRITYAQARYITGRSHGYLFKLVKLGRLSRDGGDQRQPFDTWLSRSEVEALAIAEYSPRRRTTSYWMTVREAAEALGVTGQTVRSRLPTFKVNARMSLLRREDVDRAQTALTREGLADR